MDVIRRIARDSPGFERSDIPGTLKRNDEQHALFGDVDLGLHPGFTPGCHMPGFQPSADRAFEGAFLQLPCSGFLVADRSLR